MIKVVLDMFSNVINIYDKETGTYTPYVPVDEFFKAMVYEGLYDLSREDEQTFERLKSVFITWMLGVVFKYKYSDKIFNDIATLLHVDSKELKEYFDEIDEKREQLLNEKIKKIILESAKHRYNVQHKKHLKLVK
jgi:hypothetical protein